ncbi:AAA family ATPase [Spirulina subsalsa FACHB-351]|uniref:Nuclease SbcCD subunit C n=1 Tax=Spirulina subsalsa FACHB-351 TaxID=234711 RepID=A0ABT3L9W6_9CYAN|nr:AAA family ATPase [Spirulina subsalsa]MCW6037765.1 AAA family ATPase [Spirulina subsalsa FACHB-351]
MRLISIRLCNFRQFYGKTPEIYLASGTRNTTVIHGNNGAGKTTLLNAFTWALYERFTAAFASPELLVNKRAIAQANVGTSIDCHVEIQFEHETKRYQVKRQCYAWQNSEGKIEYGSSKLFMKVAGDDGRWMIPTEQPEDIIGRILPESLHQYFFFDGERIDHIFRSEQKSRIAEDTKELLGVKVLDRAVEHLKKAKKTLGDELKTIGDSATKKLLREQGKLEQQKERVLKRQGEIETECAALDVLKQQVNERLRELSGSAELQSLKLELEQQEKGLRENLGRAKGNLRHLISASSYTVFTGALTGEFRGVLLGLRERGALPSGIKQRFVEQLLREGYCICGTPLEGGSGAYEAVQDWLNRAGMADVEEAAIRLEAQVGELEQQIPQFWQRVDYEQGQIQQWRSQLARVEGELDTVQEKLRTYPDENIQGLQKRLDETESQIRSLLLEQGGNQQEIERLQGAIADCQKQVDKHKLKEEKQALAQRRIQVTQEAIARLIEVRSRLEQQFRLSLESRVQEIFATISFTPYFPRLSPDYELSLMENTSGIAVPVAASTGENQILSLSFIGGIIDRVREWSQENTLMGPDSSTFPIVMDSPFGSLDEIYRRHVARAIPQLANQLVVLVSKTQWRGEVAEEMAQYIGKQYVLVYYSPKPDCEVDQITLGTVTYPLVQTSDSPYEYTEIKVVEGRE